MHGEIRAGGGDGTRNLSRRDARPRIPAPVKSQNNTAHAAWSPHSVLSNIAQRPARASSPGAVRRVHGQQPTDANPWSIRALTGTLKRLM